MIGLVALLTLPFVVRALSILHGGLAEAVLCGRASSSSEVARVEGGRDAARVAEAASLRRLERDIHDGPQQRLVRLSMDLGRARKQLDQDPEKVARDHSTPHCSRPARPSTSCARCPAASRRRCWSTVACARRSVS